VQRQALGAGDEHHHRLDLALEQAPRRMSGERELRVAGGRGAQGGAGRRGGVAAERAVARDLGVGERGACGHEVVRDAAEVPRQVRGVAQHELVQGARVEHRAEAGALDLPLGHGGATIRGSHHVRMAYRELPPPHELAHLVRCLWIRTGTGDETLVLPDGCLDVIVRDGMAVVAGPDTGPVPAQTEPGTLVTGLRLRPGAAAALGIPGDELRDVRVPLDDLWGSAGRELGERVDGDPLALASALRGRLLATPLDPRMFEAARRLAREPETPVPALAEGIGLGERHLRRRFAAAVGYGPKTFARIARFRAALTLIRSGEPLASAALAAGYADQAHMTREMAALAGRTPGALAGSE
jgi:AraC-like DNA-binding protein